MGSFLSRFPKLLIAVVAISLSAAFIIYQNPPHTVCEIQMDDFKTSMQGIIVPKVIQGKSAPPVFNSARDACRYGNSMGACADYIQLTMRIAREVRKLNSECLPVFAELKNFRAIFEQFLGVLVFSAWGSKAPEENAERFGWLNEAHLAVFCRIKDLFVELYGKPALDTLTNDVMKGLPGTSEVDELVNNDPKNKNIKPDPNNDSPKPAFGVTTKTAYEFFQAKGSPDPRTDIWRRSIFSTRCEFFR